MNGDERGIPRHDRVEDAIAHLSAQMSHSDPTEYNRKQQQASMDSKVANIRANITEAEKKLQSGNAKNLIAMMDIVESVIKTCGGETKVTYLDVTSTFIKVATRVPLSANLFQFLPETDDNPRFHKVVTKLLLLSPSVTGVRWLPDANGAFLLVTVTGFSGGTP